MIIKKMKIILIGDSGAGKTSLIQRFHKNQFQNYAPTVAADIATGSLKTSESLELKYIIWDTAGQQNFRSVIRQFYKQAQGIFLIFSIAKLYKIISYKSFQSLDYWLKQAKQHAKDSAIFFLIGCQADRLDQRQVSKQEAINFQQKNEILNYVQTSAKSGDCVKQTFQQNMLLICEYNEKQNGQGVQHLQIEKKQSSECC